MKFRPDECKSYEELQECCWFYMERCESLSLEKKALMSFIPNLENISIGDLVNRMNEIREQQEKKEAEEGWNPWITVIVENFT